MKDVKLLIMIDEDLLKRINKFRFKSEIGSKSEAVRQLLEKGLASSGYQALTEKDSIGAHDGK